MAKKPFNVLITPVGNQKDDDGKAKIRNVTDVIDLESIPVQITDQQGETKTIYDKINPDIVYMLVSKDSVDNANEIIKKYRDRHGMKILTEPESIADNDSKFPDPFDFTALVQRIYTIKSKVTKYVKTEHASENLDVRFFINLTPGTKIITAAASVAAIGIDARMCYVLDDEFIKPGREKHLVFKPQSTFNFDDLPATRKQKIWFILNYLRDKKEHTRSEIYSSEDNNNLDRQKMSPQTIGNNVADLISKDLIEERDPTKRKKSPIKITELGLTVLGYLDNVDKDRLSKKQCNNSKKTRNSSIIDGK